MQNYGRVCVADLLGDFVVYRALQPADARLPGRAQLTVPLDLKPGERPRKGEPTYARVVAEILQQARRLLAPNIHLRRLVWIGDTRMSDAGAFRSVRAAGGWEGRALICSEEAGAPPSLTDEGDGLFTAHRWTAVPAFAEHLEADRFRVDESTAIVVDLDKTLLGARGRNDRLIDQARVTALRATVSDLLRQGFDAGRFERAYNALNRPAYHPFTGDNQDYLAYICLMIGAGVLTLEELLAMLQAGEMQQFPDFVQYIDRRPPVDPDLVAFHRDFAELVRSGDPTPFKAFRRREFEETLALMGCLPDDTPPEDLLRGEIVLTAEVWRTARHWAERGAVLLGLSDKPDEAAMPPAPAGRTQGQPPPLHRMPTHLIGE